MNHAPWCQYQHGEHVVCTRTIDDIVLADSQRVIVGVHQARGAAAIATLLHKRGASEHLVVLNRDSGRQLVTAIAAAIGMLT